MNLAHAPPTTATVIKYTQRGQHLLRRCANELDVGEDALTAEQFADWLIGLKPTIAKTTWRLYKASALSVIDRLPGGDAARQCLEFEAQTGAKPKGVQTSAKRRNHLPYHDFCRLYDRLTSSNRKHSGTLADFLRAELVCGFRLAEWPTAEWSPSVDFQHVLTVENGKHTEDNDRAFAPYRSVILDGVDREWLASVIRSQDAIHRYQRAGQIDTLYRAWGDLMRQMSHELWPRRKTVYGLYSLRHQAIANHKAISEERAQVAAYAGHASLASASRHYASGRKGMRFLQSLGTERGLHPDEVIAAPSPDDVLTVHGLNPEPGTERTPEWHP